MILVWMRGVLGDAGVCGCVHVWIGVGIWGVGKGGGMERDEKEDGGWREDGGAWGVWLWESGVCVVSTAWKEGGVTGRCCGVLENGNVEGGRWWIFMQRRRFRLGRLKTNIWI